MLCPQCKIDMTVKDGGIELEGDKSPDTETIVFQKQEFLCRNKVCPNYGKIVFENKVKLN